MQIPRAAFVLLAGFAAGVGARMVFPLPAEDGSEVPRRVVAAGQDDAGMGTIPKPHPGPRPEASAILTADGGSRLRLLMAWLPEATDEELAHMADDLMRSEFGENLSVRLLMARWAEENPSGMVKWADKQGSDFYRQHAIESWARVDFDAAWAMACATRLECRGSALLGLTAVDPDKCLRVLRADPALLTLAGKDAVLARIAGHDPAGAASLLVGLPVARQSAMAGGVVREWVKTDPASAIAWLRTLTPAVRSASVWEAGVWLAENAPEHTQALLEALPAGPARSQIAATAFEKLAQRDVSAARLQLDRMTEGPARQYCRALLMKELLRAGDEAGATALAAQLGWKVKGEWSPAYSSTKTESMNFSSHGAAGELDAALGQLLGRIAARDPMQAAEILIRGDGFSNQGLVASAAAHDPAALAAAVLAGAGDAGHVVYAWAKTDPEAAVVWTAANAKDDGECARLVWPALSIWAVADPAAVSRWAAGQGELTRGMAWDQMVLGSWDYAASHPDELFAANQPPAVSKLLEKLASSPEQERAILQQMPDAMDTPIGNSVQRWLQADAVEASQWVRDLPPGARRTNATAAMVAWLNCEGDREGAFHWAATLPEEKRAPLIKDTIVEWVREDPSAAMQSVSTADLPAEEALRWVRFLNEQIAASPLTP